MSSSVNISESLLRLILPKEIFEYFEILSVEERGKDIVIELEEINNPPEEYASDSLTSKGFYPWIEVNDFPLRNRPLVLRIKRRRWLNESTGKTVSRDWQLVAEGTRYTQGFASFLKGLIGYIPDKYV
jgi:hypothetical protein